MDPEDVSVIKAVSPLKPRPSSDPVSPMISTSSDLDKHQDLLQDEWTTLFTRIEALLPMKPTPEPFFSPVKAPVSVARSSVTSAVSKIPLFAPAASD